MRIYYQLTTKEPLVLSQSTATTNNHLGLDYIPGSAVLGAIASRIYNQLPAEQSYALFHSGACRFGPAYPLVNDEIALPIPAAWHGLKLNNEKISNHAAEGFERDDEQQYKQRREGFIVHTQEEAKVKQGITTRTALGDDLRVEEGQLYTYTTLQAGQEFGGWIETESEELLALVKPLLTGELNIGRSRSSEFGRVALYCPKEQPESVQVNNLKTSLVLWCLSDAQCFDKNGSPVFTPTVSSLHPSLEGQLNPEKSFIRTRKVRRFNRARNGLDTEQQLIAAGSVLVYDLAKPATDEVLNALAASGIGVNRQQGLGWLQVNPAWASQVEPKGQLFQPTKLRAKPPVSVTIKTTPLIAWVEQKLDVRQTQKATDANILKLHTEILAAYENARSYNGLPIQYQAGPSNSQWRRLDDLVKNHEDWQRLAFDGADTPKEDKTGVCKAENDELGWGLSWQTEHDGLITFSDFAKSYLSQHDNLTMRRLLEQLCRYDLSTSQGLSAYKQFIQPTKQGAQA